MYIYIYTYIYCVLDYAHRFTYGYYRQLHPRGLCRCFLGVILATPSRCRFATQRGSALAGTWQGLGCDWKCGWKEDETAVG